MSFCMAVFAPVSTRTKYIPLEIPSAFQATLWYPAFLLWSTSTSTTCPRILKTDILTKPSTSKANPNVVVGLNHLSKQTFPIVPK